MLTEDRHRRILDAVRVSGAASVKGLAERLAVSESTIRRDLVCLDRSGDLVRTYGGALVPASGYSTGSTDPAGSAPAGSDPASTASGAPDPQDPVAGHSPVPAAAAGAATSADPTALARRVAGAAAGLVREGDVVLLDTGAVPALVARALRGRDVTVITASLAVLDELRADPVVRLVLLGGVLQRGDERLAGSLTELGLGRLNADLLLLSCTGVRASGRVVDGAAVEVPVKQAMIEAADRVVLLASEAALPGTGSFRVCSLDDVAVLVTTTGADPATIAVCRAAGGRVVLA